jgi:hypothetical protein
MPVLSNPDPHAPIACSLPVLQMSGRLDALQDLVGDRVRSMTRDGNRLRIAIDATDRPSLHAEAVAWANAEKACCAFLGFAVEETPTQVTLEIATPAGAEPMLDGFEWLVRAAGRVVAAA